MWTRCKLRMRFRRQARLLVQRQQKIALTTNAARPLAFLASRRDQKQESVLQLAHQGLLARHLRHSTSPSQPGQLVTQCFATCFTRCNEEPLPSYLITQRSWQSSSTKNQTPLESLHAMRTRYSVTRRLTLAV